MEVRFTATTYAAIYAKRQRERRERLKDLINKKGERNEYKENGGHEKLVQKKNMDKGKSYKYTS